MREPAIPAGDQDRNAGHPRLVPFASCRDTLRGLRMAATAAVTAEFTAGAPSPGAAGSPPTTDSGRAAPAGAPCAAGGLAGRRDNY